MIVLSQEIDLSVDLMLLEGDENELEFPPDSELQKGFLLEEAEQ